MPTTWIESAAKGRNGGPVRAGVWSSVVIGTHPIEAGQKVGLEIACDEVSIGTLPAFWVENRGVNSLWHVPIPPQPVGTRLHYRSVVQKQGAGEVTSPFQDTIVRPNLPDRTESPEIVSLWPEGIVGNRYMTVRVDGRGSTQDIYFPTVGLHSSIRPAEGDLPQSRSHFRGIVGGLALENRLDWFNERLNWDVFQHYQGATNLLRTEMTWRRGPIRVIITDFAAAGPCQPQTAGGVDSPGQYLKRFRILNSGTEPIDALFGVYVQAEVNGGLGESGLSWEESNGTLLATNRGHGHVNRKLARDATVEFAIALDDRGEVQCEPTGPNEAVLLRQVHLPAGGHVAIDLLVSGAFTGWRGDAGTFQHWLRPALQWFRSTDLDQVEQCTAQEWDAFVEPLPSLNFPKPTYAVSLRRSALAAALHVDAKHGSVASGYDRGLSAYCWPREAIQVGETFSRLGHPEIGREVYRWLGSVRGGDQAYSYWLQKYSIDGSPEWETPAIDQTALIPWGIERLYRRTGSLDFVASQWGLIERAAGVCVAESGHPGLFWVDELSLIHSAGLWESRFGAFLFSNACVVAGLRAACRLATLIGKGEVAKLWQERADRIWNVGILGVFNEGSAAPGLVDAVSGRFLEARRVSLRRGVWAERSEDRLEHSNALDIGMLAPALPLDLLPASDQRMRRTAEAIFRRNSISTGSNLLTRWAEDSGPSVPARSSGQVRSQDLSSLATLWMCRYLLKLGRESGEGRHWNLAVSMLDALLARLSPLGLAVRSSNKLGDGVDNDPGGSSGVWGLHSMLIETLLDLAGMDYDGVDNAVQLDPALPVAWPTIGMVGKFPCGEVSYRLERPLGGSLHRLIVRSNLERPTTLNVQMTCPGLNKLGPWQGHALAEAPKHDPITGRLAWSDELPEGESSREWTWG